jgi:protein-tyrosine kinase
MSKIYEALLRAEQDQAAVRKAPPPVEVAHANRTEAQSLQDQFLASQTMSAQRLGTRAQSAFPHPSLGRPLQVPDLPEIPIYQWEPSLSQLPALQERGVAVEQFRSLRSRMQEFRDASHLKSILISSGLPQEGKSFIAANLAISFARHKSSRVLLIDGDMRRSTLHQFLGAPQKPGLTEFLAGKATLNEILQRTGSAPDGVPLPTSLASITFIAGGGDSDKSADLAGNRRFDELMAAVSPQFDWIVVDSSPVTLVSDAASLARACDGVLLIARGGVTKFEVAQRALVELKAAKLLGVVLNAVDKTPLSKGYYGQDNYVGTLEKSAR